MGDSLGGMSVVGERRDWEDLAVLDPHWAILSQPDRRFGGGDIETFYGSGRTAISAVLRDGERFGFPVGRRAALDFGCGTARLTRALASHFESCIGIDVSAEMIAQARAATADLPNCRFAVHDAPDLSPLTAESFDLVVSFIALQHVTSDRAKAKYIEEFVRVLRPGGLLAFQLPSRIPARHRLQARPRLYRALRRAGVARTLLYGRLHLHPIRMTSLTRSRVLCAIERAGGRTLEVRDETITGGVTSSDYLVTRN